MQITFVPETLSPLTLLFWLADCWHLFDRHLVWLPLSIMTEARNYLNLFNFRNPPFYNMSATALFLNYNLILKYLFAIWRLFLNYNLTLNFAFLNYNFTFYNMKAAALLLISLLLGSNHFLR